MAVLNSHLLDTGTPPIPEAMAWLSNYRDTLGPVINLSQAVPGDPPPQIFLDQLSQAAGQPEATRYGGILGDDDLRAAYAHQMSKTYGAELAGGNMAITSGCNQAFFVSIMALAKAGEAVMVPSPWYFNHKMTLDMLGIETVPLPLRAENGFCPDVEVARALMTNKVRAIVLVTPNNPTGAVYSADLLQRFLVLCQETGTALIVDETYRDFLPEQMHPHDLFQKEGWNETLISLYSFSKSYAIPGHRLGAIAAGTRFIDEVSKVLDCIQICPARAAQMVLPWAFENLEYWKAQTATMIQRRIRAFQAAMREAALWQIDQIGAYFAYVRHPFDGVPSSKVAEALATHCGVLTLPGNYFGPMQDDYLRVAFANVDDGLLSGLGRRFAALPEVAGVPAQKMKLGA